MLEKIILIKYFVTSESLVSKVKNNCSNFVKSKLIGKTLLFCANYILNKEIAH